MITQSYDYLKGKSYEKTDQPVSNIFLLKMMMTECYYYLKRKSYEQTDQSVRNFFSSNNDNTVL